MAMTKAEQSRFNEALKAVEAAKALSWPSYRDTRIDAAEIAKGVGHTPYPAWTFNKFSGRVERGCFTRVHHAVGQSHSTSSQGMGGPWYESQLTALHALRIAKTIEFAEALRALDKLIEAEAEGQ